MRRFALVLVAALAATGCAVSATDTAAASVPAARSEQAKVAHYCRSLDNFIRFLRKAPKPSKFDTPKGRKVLRELKQDPPKQVKAAARTVSENFTTMARHGKGALSKREHRETNSAMLKVAVVGATKCKQQLVRKFGSALVAARIDAAEQSSSSTTKP
jgi:hypothetical protein